MAQPLSFRWDAELIKRIDAARGDVPRSMFVRRAVESALLRSNGYEPTSTDRQALPPAKQARMSKIEPTAPVVWNRCPDCGKANGVHKGDCPRHPGRAGR